MKSCSNTLVILLVAATASLWLQDASAGPLFGDTLPFDSSSEEFTNDMDSLFDTKYNQANSTGPNIFWGSVTIQKNNKYPKGSQLNIIGSQDIQIGNTYPENPNGTNVYGPILIQENNSYGRNNENAQYGATLTQVGNIYPKNPGKNDIYGPIVIRNNNTYRDNIGNNTVFGAVVNQINNTYPQALEGNEDALNPIIIQNGTVYPSTSRTNSVIGAVVNRSGNRFHLSQDHHKRLRIGMGY